MFIENLIITVIVLPVFVGAFALLLRFIESDDSIKD